MTCDATFARCRCTKAEGHAPEDEVHLCAPECGGSWTIEDGQNVPVTFPGIALGVAGLAAALLGFEDDELFEGEDLEDDEDDEDDRPLPGEALSQEDYLNGTQA